MTKIQTALGRNFKALLLRDFESLSDTAVGQLVQDSVRNWLDKYVNELDGSEMTTSIHSNNLRTAAGFSAYNARLTYLLGKATLLSSYQRRCIVRTQIIEYGAVCEAMLLDLVHSVGVTNRPHGVRPLKDAREKTIDWSNGGLFRTKPNSSAFKYRADFVWLISVAASIDASAFGGTMNAQLNKLRERRNLIHNATAKTHRYTDDLDAARNARSVAVELCDRCQEFKRQHRLPR